MGIAISYCIGALCILLPRIMAKVIAETLDFITKHRYGPASAEQKKVRPIFSVIVGVTMIAMTAAVHSSK